MSSGNAKSGSLKIRIAEEKNFLFIPHLHSARKTIRRENACFLLSIAALVIAVLGLLNLVFGIRPLVALVGLCIAFYLFILAFRLDLILQAANYGLIDFSREELSRINERELPPYTILVPLFKEANVVGQITGALRKLDYPKRKLDVKLLLEADDAGTMEAVRKERLPAYFEKVVVPVSHPRTKPKALNAGLSRVRGKYLVLYDAEDMPERDQLKKVHLAFSNQPGNVACVQCKLNYYNRDQNVLTRLFTAEYATWFDLYLPGLQARGYPIPLGGTSNHFRTSVLKRIGAWDPFNVAEDCDLGMRLARLGYKTVLAESTTWEEANSRLGNWIRQRSRWMKGYLQTFFVHTRNPTKSIRDFGLGNFLAFLLFVPGTPMVALLNLFFWALTGIWFATRSPAINALFPSVIFYPALFSLVVGNFVFLYVQLLGCAQRRFYGLIKWSLLSPVYWLLMSAATLRSMVQMLHEPHLWEKTIHGLHFDCSNQREKGGGSLLR